MTTDELHVLQWRATLALAGRETRRVVALWTQTVAPAVVTALLFLLIFGEALGGRLRHVEGLDYASFILPGLLVVTVAGQAFANASTSLFQAKNEGYIDDLLTSPLRAPQLALGYMTGGLVRSGLAALAVALVGIPATGRIHDPAVLFAALLLTGLVFAALGVITGMWAETFDQHAFVANLVVTPLALLGGVFYSARTLSEPWATLTRVDPLYYLVDATRAGVTGFHESTLWLALVLAGLTAAVMFVAASALLAGGWRLKP